MCPETFILRLIHIFTTGSVIIECPKRQLDHQQLPICNRPCLVNSICFESLVLSVYPDNNQQQEAESPCRNLPFFRNPKDQ